MISIIFSSIMSLQVNADFDSVVEIFENKCISCHGTGFFERPRLSFMKGMDRMFDLKRDGQVQRVPPRMAGVRLTTEEAIEVKEWILNGAPSFDGVVNFDESQIKKILR